MIKPSIGRVVWFQPSKPEDQPFHEQPYAALVSYVWSDTMVNLAVFDQNGMPFSATSVRLLQDDEEKPVFGHFAEWMPYQKGQAKNAKSSFEHEFTAGDIVCMGQGFGPAMTVNSVSGDELECVWFTGEGSRLSRESFHAATLRKVGALQDT